MKKQIFGAIIIVLATLTLSGALTSYFLLKVTQKEFQGFESDFNDWIIDSDVPLDPNNPGNEVNWSINRTQEPSKVFSGNYSLQLFIDGRQDDGVIWIEKEYSLKPNTCFRVSITFQFYCGGESFNTITRVIAYCNITNPEIESDLTEGLIGSGEQAPTWKKYSQKTTLKTSTEGILWIAIGMSVVWETEVTHYIDDLSIIIR